MVSTAPRGRPKKKERMVPIIVMVPVDLKKELASAGVVWGYETLSDVVRAVLRAGLQEMSR